MCMCEELLCFFPCSLFLSLYSVVHHAHDYLHVHVKVSSFSLQLICVFHAYRPDWVPRLGQYRDISTTSIKSSVSCSHNYHSVSVKIVYNLCQTAL